MDVKKRNESIAGFKAASRSPKVLIVSLKAGGVGLNVSALRSHILLLLLVFVTS